MGSCGSEVKQISVHGIGKQDQSRAFEIERSILERT